MFIHLKNFNEKKIRFSKKGSFIVYFYNVSGEVEFDIVSSGVNVKVFALYWGKKTDRFVLTTKQSHNAPDSSSDVLVKSVMDDYSQFKYTGLIQVTKQAIGTHAYQKNMNLMLSHTSQVISQPFLEIRTDSVFCTHGSTTGSLDKTSLEFLQARGISFQKARKLLVDGFVTDLYNRIRKSDPSDFFIDKKIPSLIQI